MKISFTLHFQAEITQEEDYLRPRHLRKQFKLLHDEDEPDKKSEPSFHTRSTSRSRAIRNCSARPNSRDLSRASTPPGAEYCVSLISCLARCNKYSLMRSVTICLLNSRQERNAITGSDTQKYTALNGTYVQNVTYRKTAQFSTIYTTYHFIPTLNSFNVAAVHTFTRSS